jgi:hypothetical protein
MSFQNDLMSCTRTNLPLGAVAYQKYQVTMPDRSVARIAITLGDMEADTNPAALAREEEATCHGLIVIRGLSDAPLFPMVWMRREGEAQVRLGMSVADENCVLSEDLKPVIAYLLAKFLADVGDDAEISLHMRKTANDNTLH